MLLAGLALAALIGLSLGLLGGGGSILSVPMLIYVLGVAPKAAIAMSLPIVGVTSLVGALVHWRRGSLHARPALLFGGIAMIGAFAGARLAMFLSDTAQLLLLASVMLAAAVAMMRPARARTPTRRPAARPRLIMPAALFVGVLTGVVGIGGGFLVVPALVLLAGVPFRQAIGTSLLVIAMNAAAGLAGYAGALALDWSLTASLSALAATGAVAGATLAARVPPAALRQAFAVLLAIVAGLVLYQNIPDRTTRNVARTTIAAPGSVSDAR